MKQTNTQNTADQQTVLDLAVIIVTWNIRELIVGALDSLFADLETSGLRSEVYVVDSASTDGTPQVIAEKFPQVKLIVSRENLGFGRANNLGMRQAGFSVTNSNAPRAAYLLNPDTITKQGATRTLFDALMQLPDAGMVGANLTYEDGSFQHGAFTFPGLRQLWVEFFPTPGRLIEGRFNGRYPRARYEAGEPFKVDFTLGATMMLKREVIAQTNMFDENFFMYAEEVDWAWRIRKMGWEIYTVPEAHVVHLAGKSTGKVRAQSVLYLWQSRLKLFEKHYPYWKLWVAKRMIARGMARKALQATDSELKMVYRQIESMVSNESL